MIFSFIVYTSFVLMSTFYQKEIVLTNVRNKKEKNSFAESFSLSELCDLKPFVSYFNFDTL